MRSSPLELGTETYHWKPMLALFRSLELPAYQDAGTVVPGPTLDLGCGDGRVAGMLKRIAVVGDDLYGLDLLIERVDHSRALGVHRIVVQGNAEALPFGRNNVSSIIANGTFEAVPGSIEETFEEIGRVLKPGGLLVCTMPTARFEEVLLIPRILRRHLPALGARDTAKLNKRTMHFNWRETERWLTLLRRNGLEILQHREFFSNRSGPWRSGLSLQIFRIFRLLELAKIAPMQRRATKGLRVPFDDAYRDDHRGDRLGYVFVIARKA